MVVDMPEGMTLRGSVDISARVSTVGELRRVMQALDDIGVPDEANAGESIIYVYLDSPAHLIECGDHEPPVVLHDFLIPTHTHAAPTVRPPSQAEWLGHGA